MRRPMAVREFSALFGQSLSQCTLAESYTPPSTPIQRKCDCCGEKCHSECMCGEAFCSRECMKKDWKNHRRVCETIFGARESIGHRSFTAVLLFSLAVSAY